MQFLERLLVGIDEPMGDLYVLLADDRVDAIKESKDGATVVAVLRITNDVMQGVDGLGMTAAQKPATFGGDCCDDAVIVSHAPCDLRQIRWCRIVPEAGSACCIGVTAVPRRPGDELQCEAPPFVVREGSHLS